MTNGLPARPTYYPEETNLMTYQSHTVHTYHPTADREAAGYGSVVWCDHCGLDERMLTRDGAEELAREHAAETATEVTR